MFLPNFRLSQFLKNESSSAAVHMENEISCYIKPLEKQHKVAVITHAAQTINLSQT
jgi:hypothetical protein